MGLLGSIFKGIFGGGFGRKTVTTSTIEKIDSDWRNIRILIKEGRPSQLRQALITADKTVDAALKDLVVGETMGERLKNSRDLFDRDVYDLVWKAHKMRNSIVHEAGFEPNHMTVTRSVENLKKGLKDLGVRID